MANAAPSSPSRQSALRLYPLPPVALDPCDVYADLRLPAGKPGGKPYTVINAVTTLDCRATIDGRSSKVGSANDRRIMRNLRCAVDGVLVGAGTLRAEDLDLGVPQELVRRRRENLLADQPLLIILKGKKALPEERKLYEGVGEQSDRHLLIFGPRGAPTGPMPEHATFRVLPPGAQDGRLVPKDVLSILATEFGVRRLLVEGGPAVNHCFLSGGLVEELFLTLAPRISGEADAQTIVSGAATLPQEERDARLLSVHAAGGELYLRYRLREGNQEDGRRRDPPAASTL